MKVIIGRFEGSVPDKDPFDIFCKIMAVSLPNKKDTIQSPAARLHRFFFEMKSEFPDLFENFYFSSDPDIPYSEEIAKCFLGVQECGFISRPNPDHYDFEVASQFGALEKDDPDYDSITRVAERLKDKFEIKKADECVQS